MDYFGIIKKAYHITIKNKFLWIFGVLIAGIGGGIASFDPSLSYDGSSPAMTNAQFEQKIADIWLNYGSIILIGVAIFLFLGVIFFILNIISQGALIGAVDRIDRGEKTDFKTGLRIGAKNFWRVWGMAIIYLLLILASLCLLIIPAAVLTAAGSYVLAIIWAVLLFFVCILFWFMISVIAPYSTIVVVLEKLSVWDSLRESLHLFRKKWPPIIVMYLLLIAIGIGYGLALMLVFLVFGGIALAVGMALWLVSMWASLIFALSLGLLLIVAMVIINGAFKSFGSAVLTLTYNRIK